MKYFKLIMKNIFNFMEWFIFLALCITSIFFMWEVLEKFKSEDTSIKQFEKNISFRPVITICPNFGKKDRK